MCIQVLHSHRARHSGVYLVAGNHTLRSLTGLPSICEHAPQYSPQALACAAGKAKGQLDGAREAIVRSAASRMICYDDLSVPSYMKMPRDSEGNGGFYDRQGSFVCRDHSFKVGDIFTVFSFSSAVWTPTVNRFPQHTLLFFYYQDDMLSDAERPDSNYNIVFPTHMGQWEPVGGAGTYVDSAAVGDGTDPVSHAFSVGLLGSV